MRVTELPLRTVVDAFDQHAKGMPKEDDRAILEQMRSVERGGPEWIELRNRLVEQWYMFAKKVARKYARTEADFEDLTQEAVIGLILAADKWNFDADTRYSTYATYWIIQRCQRYRARNWHRLTCPHTVFAEASVARQERARLTQILLREPTIEELSEFSERPPERLALILALTDNFSTDYEHIGLRNRRLTTSETQRAIEGVDAADEQDMLLVQIRKMLNARMWDIFRRRFGFGCDAETLEQVAAVHNITRERVRQIETKMLEKVKAVLVRYGYQEVRRKAG
jgi:RNA polymerase primary sigma factor